MLVFDEMITGLRSAPGGAQELFGVRADLATYGKILGGGLQLAAVAGRAALLDGVDGGGWRYGDDSYPQADTSFFAGTFCAHPLALASARAVLRELLRRGPALQQGLNARTTDLATRLNACFSAHAAPVRVHHFGSLFRFAGGRDLDLLLFGLLDRGVFVWEGRNCFLSTAHGDGEVERIVAAVADSVRELQEDGLLRDAGAVAHASARADDTLELSDAQAQLRLLASLDERASRAYVESVALELEGDVDVELLADAVRATVARHEALRTTFDARGERQRVHATLDVPLELGELDEVEVRPGGDPAGDGDPRERAWCDELVTRRLDLERGPLLRAGLLRLGAGRRLLVVAGHHIALDGASLAIVVNDIATLYSAARVAAAPPGPPAAQFRDVLRQQHEHLTSAQAIIDERYWRERLAGAESTELDGDRPRPAAMTWSGGRRHLRVGAGLRERLEALGRAGGATLFATLLASYLAFLSRSTGRDDLLVGCPELGREVEGSAEVVGYCAHLLAIRVRIDERAPFSACLATVRDGVLEAHEHRGLPFARLLRTLGLSWDGGRQPLVSMVFNLERPGRQPVFEGARATLVRAPTAGAKFDLATHVLDTGDELLVDFDYAVDLFDGDTIEAFGARYCAWLERLVDAPQTPLVDLPLIADEERELLLRRARGPQPDPTHVEPTLADVVARIAPGRPAIEETTRTHTYGEIASLASRLADRLRAAGVLPGDPVAVHGASPATIAAALIAIIELDCAYVVGSARGGAKVAIVDPAAGSDDTGVVALGEDAGRLVSPEHADVLALPDDTPAGAPEEPALVVDAAALRAAVAQARATLGLRRDERVAVAGCEREPWTLLAILGAGAVAVARHAGFGGAGAGVNGASARDADAGAGDASATSCGVMLVSCEIPARAGAALADVRQAFVVGGELDAGGFARLRALLHDDCELRALHIADDRCAISAAQDLAGETPPVRAPIGAPAAGVRMYVLDALGELVAPGIGGELCIAGAGLPRGYSEAPALTALRLLPDPFAHEPGARLWRSGVRARMRTDGLLEALPPAAADATTRDGAAADAAASAAAAPVAPRTPLESELLDFWRAVLGISDGGVEDDFFALGGHSLLAMRLIARVAESLGVDVPLRSLFERPTVAALAREITALRNGAGDDGRDASAIPALARERHRVARSLL